MENWAGVWRGGACVCLAGVAGGWGQEQEAALLPTLGALPLGVRAPPHWVVSGDLGHHSIRLWALRAPSLYLDGLQGHPWLAG